MSPSVFESRPLEFYVSILIMIFTIKRKKKKVKKYDVIASDKTEYFNKLEIRLSLEPS